MISFERVRKLCLSLDDVEEKLSHGEPTFFVCNRVFVMYSANHHGDLRYALWCNVPEGAQEAWCHRSRYVGNAILSPAEVDAAADARATGEDHP